MIARSFEEIEPFLKELLKLDLRCFDKSSWDSHTWKGLFNNHKLALIQLRKKNSLWGFIAFTQIDFEVELLKIGVDPNYLRQGAGTDLMKQMLFETARLGVKRIFLEVRKDNFAAISLYLAEEFQQTGIRAGYYSNPKTDALQFTKNL